MENQKKSKMKIMRGLNRDTAAGKTLSPETLTREEAVRKLGRYAAYTAPIMLILLASKKKAYAGSIPK
ncbi:hypothetical protein BVY01_04010 [bacterium I07]|nr:hypothetical protein BVY01_04010 [bacterium I07]